jgi:cysteine-rich repeat protein
VYTCGDGDWVVPYENCDDGNLVDFDGCSSACNIDSGY